MFKIAWMCDKVKTRPRLGPVIGHDVIFRAQSSVHLPLSSASGQQMFERSSASVDRETQGETKPKRTASAHGLNMTSEGRTDDLTNIYMRKFATIIAKIGTIISNRD